MQVTQSKFKCTLTHVQKQMWNKILLERHLDILLPDSVGVDWCEIYKSVLNSESPQIFLSKEPIRYKNLAVIYTYLRDPSENENYILQWAIERNNPRFTEFLLNTDKIDPSAYSNRALRTTKSLTMAKILMKDPRVDPHVNSEIVMSLAICRGDVPFAEYMINVKNCDISVGNYFSFYEAVKNGYCQMVKMLLTQPSASYIDLTKAIAIATKNNDLAMLETLPNYDINRLTIPKGETLIHYAIRTSNFQLVMNYIANRRCSHEDFLYAVTIGDYNIVRLILFDPYVRPSADNNKAISICAKYGYVGIFDLIRSDARFVPHWDVL